jgi:membrane-associated phospholipid phosphatase
MRTLAKMMSWLFIPLFMPVFGLLIAMYYPAENESALRSTTSLYFMPPQFKLHILSLFTILSVIAPGFSLLMLKRQKRIESVEMDIKEERNFPIGITVVYCSMLGAFVWFQIPRGLVPEVIFSLPWAGVLASAIAGLINRYEKISLHAMGAGMLFGFIVAYYNTQIIFDIDLIISVAILGGLIMSARMYLGKHTLRQSIMGYLLGFFTVFLMLTYFPSPNL